jgi:hypothetical protein
MLAGDLTEETVKGRRVTFNYFASRVTVTVDGFGKPNGRPTMYVKVDGCDYNLDFHPTMEVAVDGDTLTINDGSVLGKVVIEPAPAQ